MAIALPQFKSESEAIAFLERLRGTQGPSCPIARQRMTYYPVSLRVNNPRHDDRLCVEPLFQGEHRPSLI